ncbi:peroxisomal biogenesis factor 19-like [Ctenocephalides felis]|uniref:peroxisomal biogenesis factor 19-like n=1 Tax=Ctenocephalides felis TaxID=7515 RepID=UPI000E6E1AE1|nr:peroxisomal biogenesis factor 19-like [Ctenocephalides felis]XP_026474339.1 peroxisomal biogenesis factor 19-like [Ctenocephalides felis]
MSQEAGDKVVPSSEENDLNELLDTALEDFEKVAKPAEQPAKDDKEKQELPIAGNPEITPENMWSQEFIKKAAEQFESHMADIFGAAGVSPMSTEEFDNSIKQKLAEAAAFTMQPENIANMPPVDSEFAHTIAETLKGLNAGAENLQMPFSPEDLVSMFGTLGTEDGIADNGFIPVMQTMMQSLLSPEVLLPSMEDLKTKYPKWIEEHKDSTSAEDLERYQKQLDLINEVCEELVKEQPEDAPEVKKERFLKVFDLMQKMQELGHPPVELVGDFNLPQEFDQSQMSQTMDPSQCSIM